MFNAFSSREPGPTSLENALDVLMHFRHAKRSPFRPKTLFCLGAFSSREPGPTSLENAFPRSPPSMTRAAQFVLPRF